MPSTSKLLLKAIKMNDKKHCNCRKTFTSNQIIICVPGLANNQTSFQRVLLFKLDQILCKNEPIGIGYFSIGGEEEERRRILSIFHDRSWRYKIYFPRFEDLLFRDAPLKQLQTPRFYPRHVRYSSSVLRN